MNATAIHVAILLGVVVVLHYLGRVTSPHIPDKKESIPRDTVIVRGRDASGLQREVARVRYNPTARMSLVTCKTSDDGQPRRISFYTWPGSEGGGKYQRYKICRTTVTGRLTYHADEETSRGLVEFSHGMAPDYAPIRDE